MYYNLKDQVIKKKEILIKTKPFPIPILVQFYLLFQIYMVSCTIPLRIQKRFKVDIFCLHATPTTVDRVYIEGPGILFIRRSGHKAAIGNIF